MIRLGILHLPKLPLQHASKTSIKPVIVKTLNLQAKPTAFECIRTTTFFNKVNAEAIWKSNTTVSNPGKRRGRGRKIKSRKDMDLNKGQKIGTGRENMLWPGLSAPILRGQDVLELEKLPDDPSYKEKLIEARKHTEKKKRAQIHPLERGWVGRSVLGKSLGPPELIENGEDFDSYVLESKFLNLTDGKLGKVRSYSAFVVVGNKKGIIGVSSAKAVEMNVAVRRAQKKASKKLFQIKLEDGHTVNHDFFYQFGISKLFVYKKPPGYGLVCHRALAACCQLIGIKDIHVKIEGSTNTQNVVKAFLLGLLEQKSYQEMADEQKLHLVEQREETFRFPVVKASPSEVGQKKDDHFLFSEYIMGNRLPLKKEKQPALGYVPTYIRHLNRMHYQRNHKDVKLRLMAEFGRYESYLTEVYPECLPPFLFTNAKNDNPTES